MVGGFRGFMYSVHVSIELSSDKIRSIIRHREMREEQTRRSGKWRGAKWGVGSHWPPSLLLPGVFPLF